MPLQDTVRKFKTFTTNKYWKISNDRKTKLWQRNYYEHIIRNEKEYWKIYEYIENNPMKWKFDKYYTNN